jgi:hypothetical protein
VAEKRKLSVTFTLLPRAGGCICGSSIGGGGGVINDCGIDDSGIVHRRSVINDGRIDCGSVVNSSSIRRISSSIVGCGSIRGGSISF